MTKTYAYLSDKKIKKNSHSPTHSPPACSHQQILSNLHQRVKHQKDQFSPTFKLNASHKFKQEYHHLKIKEETRNTIANHGCNYSACNLASLSSSSSSSNSFAKSSRDTSGISSGSFSNSVNAYSYSVARITASKQEEDEERQKNREDRFKKPPKVIKKSSRKSVARSGTKPKRSVRFDSDEAPKTKNELEDLDDYLLRLGRAGLIFQKN